MSVHINIPSSHVFLKRLLYAVVVLLLCATMIGCVAYLFCSYEQLKSWYFSLNGCFYDKETWTTNFFTPDIKYKGNKLVIAGLVAAITGIIYSIYRWRKTVHYPTTPITFKLAGWGWYLAIALCAMGYGRYGWLRLSAAYDEIFSAVNCAELHPFQTISYYMLPNNHLYFNLANNLLFHFTDHHVSTGRLLSLMAYIMISVSVLSWFRQVTGNIIIAFVCTMPVIMQLTAWGFGFQARGYEWQLLCGWLSFITIWNYIRTLKDTWLKWNAIFCIGGFLMIPFFSYYIITQCLFIAFIQLYNKRIDIKYWKYQFVTGAGIFILYLPAFCFSGIRAFTANSHVTPLYKDWIPFMPGFFSTCKFFISYCFEMLCGEDRMINYVLFFIPLILFFSRDRQRRLLALFYVTLWIVYALYTIHMARNPYNRNMILHNSLTMAFTVYTFYVCMQWVVSFFKKEVFRKGFMAISWGVPVAVFCVHSVIWNNESVYIDLYYNDVNGIYNNYVNEIKEIPGGSTIGFSDECFYMYYLCRMRHFHCNKCPDGNEDIYMIRSDEPMPTAMKEKYELWKKWSDDYDIYKRK